jgi:hypothetical protein
VGRWRGHRAAAWQAVGGWRATEVRCWVRVLTAALTDDAFRGVRGWRLYAVWMHNAAVDGL